jgi:ATP-dependent RNA helicase DeaD
MKFDEADEMLNMGFREDIDFVLKNTINRKHLVIFCNNALATGTCFIAKILMTLNPEEITVGKKNSGT